MRNDFAIPTCIAVIVAFVGMLWWLVSFVSSWGVAFECTFLGVGIGGVVSAAFIVLAEASPPDQKGGP